MSTFKITSCTEGPNLFLHLHGDLDANTAVYASHQMETMDKDIKSIVINCRKLNYVSSAGLGVFLSLALLCQENNIRLALCHIPPHILNVLELIGVDKKIQLLHSEQELEQLLNSD